MRLFNNEGEVRTYLAGRTKDAYRVLFATEAGNCSPAEGAALLDLELESFHWLRSLAFEATKKIANPIRYPADHHSDSAPVA